MKGIVANRPAESDIGRHTALTICLACAYVPCREPKIRDFARAKFPRYRSLRVAYWVVPRLFWFHAFNRSTDSDVIDVLLNGPKIHPIPTSETRMAELQLGIAPHRVYAYLGRTHTQFGESAIVLQPDAVDGDMSPFDTGGLISNIVPINSYDDANRNKYLKSYTWPTSQRSTLLDVYPSLASPHFMNYLLGTAPPPCDGPHHFWQGHDVAAVWTSNLDWRSWTWEGRTTAFDLSMLHKWTCSPAKFPELLEHVENGSTVAVANAFSAMLPSYVHGGVSNLIATLRTEQAA